MDAVADRERVGELCEFVGQGLHESVDRRAAVAPRVVLCRFPSRECDKNLLRRTYGYRRCYPAEPFLAAPAALVCNRGRMGVELRVADSRISIRAPCRADARGGDRQGETVPPATH